MRAVKPTLTLILVSCLVLFAGIVLDKSTGNAANLAVTRADVTHRAVDGRGAEFFAVRKANNLLAHAQSLVAEGKSGDAVIVLNNLVRMELPANREADKLIADSYRTLGDIYRTDAAGRKAAQFYRLALQHMSPELDSGMMTDTLKLIALLQDAARPEIVSPPAAAASGSPGILDPGDDDCGSAVPVSLPFVGHMTVSPAGDHNWRSYTTTAPSIVRIETLSGDIFGDDTDLTLYGSCSGSTPGNFIQFDDDGGPGFLSLIVTACMPAGTYYLEVGGYNDTETPDDFDLAITQVGTCVIPSPDAYEPDNEIGQAKKIGFRNNGSGEGNQHGRDNKNIQHHSIFPAGDIDFVKFGLSRANWVRLETQGDANPDTVMGLSFTNGTLLAVNDDKAPGDFGSKLEVCLPQGDWRAVAIAFSANDTFAYDWAVDVDHPCLFETEPNGAIATANTIQPGSTIYGIHTFAPVGDNDYFKFTLTQQSLVTLETSGYDIFDVDTTLDLYNSAGSLIASDEDGGDGFLSTISVVLPPGTYYVNVWSFFANYYFPYGLTLTLAEPPQNESEPNDDCATANAVNLGDSVLAGISSPGDYDNYKLTVPADGAVEIETSGPFGDTVITITSADGVTFVGCDDDEGDGLFSRWSCCLPAGEYCVQVKAYDPGSTIPNYSIDFRGVGTCIPGDPLSCPSTGLSCP
jgi:hypothetical protein